MKYKFFYFLVVFNIINCSVFAQQSIYRFDELNLPFGVRSSGLGGNSVSFYETAEGLFYNPAISVMSNYGEVSLSHNMYFEGSNIEQLACVVPFGVVGFGLIGGMITTPEINIIKNNYLYNEKFYLYTLVAAGQLGVRFSRNFGFGIGLKNVSQQIYNQALSDMLYDTGILVRTNNELFTLAASLINYTFSEDAYPSAYNIGVKFNFNLPHQQTKINLLASAKIDIHTNRPEYIFGIEHWGADTLGLRVGYVYNEDKVNTNIYEQISYFTAGISLRIGDFSIDYAYLPNSILGTTHNIGVSLKFKTKKEVKIIEKECKITAEPKYFSPNNDGYYDNIFFKHDVSSYNNVSELSYIVRDEKGDVLFLHTSTFVANMLDSFYTYDGKDSSGNVLLDGKYTVEFILKDKQSSDKIVTYKSKKEEFVVDTISPNIQISVSTFVFSPDGDGINDLIDFIVNINDDNSYIDNVDVGVFTLQNKKVYQYKIDTTTSNALEIKLSWDGKDEIYGSMVPNGEYKLIVNAKDAAFNKSTKEIKFGVYIPPKEPQKIVQKVIDEKLFYIKGAKVQLDKRGIVVIYPTDDLFIKETGEINPKMYESLNSLAEIIKEKFADKKILIEGHTDSVGDNEENKRKSSAYAWKVYSYFVRQMELNGKLLEVKGWGEERPIASNKSKLGRAQNRRIEIVIPKD